MWRLFSARSALFLTSVCILFLACSKDLKRSNGSGDDPADNGQVSPDTIPIDGTGTSGRPDSFCGDGLCDFDESDSNCPKDCSESCGDGSCSDDENSVTCPADCAANCGDGICTGDESSKNCTSDCGSECGDGVCNGAENTINCVPDCGSNCGDGACTGDESSANCPADCGADCGDDKCEAGEEHCGNCPGDCPCTGGTKCINGQCVCGPAPHYQMKDGQCLPSCGAVKGAKGWSDSTCCSSGCKAGQGNSASWDCDYCCEGDNSCVDTDPPDPEVQPPLPNNFSQVVWLHKNVSKWPVTAKLSSVTFKSTNICLNYDKSNVWPGVEISEDVIVNGNPWVFIYQDGKWYAATWEWLRVKQTCKAKKSVAGDHIKKNPLNEWKPVIGQTYYFMVSGLARIPNITNVEERSNVVKVVWPGP